MARTNTTEFTYNGKSYSAIISQIKGSLCIYVPDETLHGMLPKGKAIFNRRLGLQIDSPKLSPTQHLLLSILTSIEIEKAPWAILPSEE